MRILMHTPEASIFGQFPYFTDVYFNFVHWKQVVTQQPISWHTNGLQGAVWKTLIQKNWIGNLLRTYNRMSVQQNRLLQNKMENESNHQERTRNCHTFPTSALLSCWEHCLFLRSTVASNGLAILHFSFHILFLSPFSSNGSWSQNLSDFTSEFLLASICFYSVPIILTIVQAPFCLFPTSYSLFFIMTIMDNHGEGTKKNNG